MEVLEKPSLLRAITDFFYKPAYFVLCFLLTIIGNFFGLELFTYTCFGLIVWFLCVFGRDLLPTLPLFVCCYITPSRDNNPGRVSGSLFSFQQGGYILIAIAVMIAAALVYRFIRDKELGRKAFWKCKRTLLPGLLAIAAAYLLSGIGSDHFKEVASKNLLFGFMQAAALVVPYFLIAGSVKWEKAPSGYFAWTGMCIGFILLAELLFLYIRYDLIQDGIILRSSIYSGWGHYNNFGALLAMMIPFPFCLIGKKKYSGVFYLIGLLFLGGVVFTCSRGSILCGLCTYVASYAVSLIRSREARKSWIIHVITVLLILGAAIFWFDELVKLFQVMLGFKWDPMGRDSGYAAGLEQFLENPVFGGTFFPNDYPLFTWAENPDFISFFPPRWHNTIIQLLASCGTVGILAYSFHRIQTFGLFFKRFSWKKMFPFISMVTLLITSLVDCHFYNIGPAMFYSVMLAYVEKQVND